MRIAIIGAGVSGLCAARKLKDAGLSVSLFDKSRGAGGRLSTRYAGEHEFDHGAQYFTIKDPKFKEIVDAAHQAGAVGRWAGRALNLVAVCRLWIKNQMVCGLCLLRKRRMGLFKTEVDLTQLSVRRPPLRHKSFFHASPEWSNDNVETDKEEIRNTLLTIASLLTKLDLTNPSYITLHRWLYASVAQSPETTT